ncbi:hypothetical protein BHM03_00052305 [Ensete ventricosum]|nr:hypothetical protein BHM03_00052305 [Ensete ventricosum]
MLLWLGRSIDLKGSERTAAVIDLLSFDSEKELVAPSLQSTERRWVVARTVGVGKVPLLVGADATVVVHEKDDLMQKDASDADLEQRPMNLKEGDRYVVNHGESLTTVDFGGGDATMAGAIDRSEGQREKHCGHRFAVI